MTNGEVTKEVMRLREARIKELKQFRSEIETSLRWMEDQQQRDAEYLLQFKEKETKTNVDQIPGNFNNDREVRGQPPQDQG